MPVASGVNQKKKEKEKKFFAFLSEFGETHRDSHAYLVDV